MGQVLVAAAMPSVKFSTRRDNGHEIYDLDNSYMTDIGLYVTPAAQRSGLGP